MMFFLQRISNVARAAIVRSMPMHAPAAVRFDPVFLLIVTKTVSAVVGVKPVVMVGIVFDIIVSAFADVMVGAVVGIVDGVVFGCSG